MALNKTTLKADIKGLLEDLQESEDRDAAMEDFSSGLADIIDSYIKTATVSTTVTGTCATPSGAGTIAGTGSGTLT